MWQFCYTIAQKVARRDAAKPHDVSNASATKKLQKNCSFRGSYTTRQFLLQRDKKTCFVFIVGLQAMLRTAPFGGWQRKSIMRLLKVRSITCQWRFIQLYIKLLINLFIYLSTIKKRQKKNGSWWQGSLRKNNTGLIDYFQTAHLQKKENIEVNYKSSNTYSKILSFRLILSRRLLLVCKLVKESIGQ